MRVFKRRVKESKRAGGGGGGAKHRTQNTDTSVVDKGERTQEKDKNDARRSRGNTGTIHVTDPGNLRKRKYLVNGSGQRCQMQKEDQVKKKN